jgi:hypothetical protein
MGKFFKETSTPTGIKKQPTLLLVVLVSVVVLTPFALTLFKQTENEVILAAGKGLDRPVSQQIETSNQGATEYINEKKRQEEINRTIAPEERSIKRGILTQDDISRDREKSEETKRIQFVIDSEDNLGEKSAKSTLGRRPLWERAREEGIQGMATTEAERIADADLSKMGNQDITGGAGLTPVNPDAEQIKLLLSAPRSSSTGAASTTQVYRRPRDPATEAQNQRQQEFSQHFLPAGQLIPVVFVTGVDTRGRTDNMVILQLARPNVAQHQVQLATARFLGRFEEELLGANEKESRIAVTVERILYPNGTETALNGAQLYDALDKRYGVIAERVIPPLWKQLLPGAIADASAGILQGSQTRTENLTNNATTIQGSTANALRQGGANAIQGASKILQERLAKENQPYSYITPGAVAFILLENAVDLSDARVNGVALRNPRAANRPTNNQPTGTFNPNGAGANETGDLLRTLEALQIQNQSNTPLNFSGGL